MCEELEVLRRDEEYAIRRYDRTVGMLDGAIPAPPIGLSKALQAKIDAAEKQRMAAHERVEKHRAEHGCA
jgi:hypothetical protein